MIRLKSVVDLLEAKPNKMFSEEMRALVRFLRFYRDGKPEWRACAECGQKKRGLWTMLCSFQAHSMAAIVPLKSGKVHAPLTPVCDTHLLAPEYDTVEEKRNVKKQGVHAKTQPNS